MSYKKTVKGENISADEIAAHNHIQIFNDGSGKLIVCFLMLLCIVGGSATWRHVSNTRREHLVNETEIEWSRLVYRTENLIATLNRSTREITVHNAQQIQEVHHHAPMQISAY
jgi:hypothetical protein